VFALVEFGKQRVGILAVGNVAADVDRKITIGTLARTKGDMHVDPGSDVGTRLDAARLRSVLVLLLY
jgi:hypothetical protein